MRLNMPRLRSVAALTAALFVLALIGILVSRRFGGGVALNALYGVAFLASCGAVLFLLLEVSTTLLHSSRDARNRLRLLLATTLLLLSVVEMVLRFGVRRYTTYPEQNGFFYGSLYKRRTTSWYHTMESRPVLDYSKTEFTHHRTINSMGLCEREIPLEKTTGEYRVVALGDSFTEGVGASYDRTWVKVFERRIAAAMPENKVTSINAGISGSDPIYQYMLLRDRLLPLKPDLVIVATNSSDVYDVLIRGGLERFRPDGSTQFVRKAPRWEPLYASSHVVRLIVHEVLGYNWLLIKETEMESPTRIASEQILSVFAAFRELADKHGFDLLVVLHPASRHDVINHEYGNGLDLVASQLKQNESIESIDLLDYYRRTGTINKENVGEFFWTVDGHHNADGYRAMGDAIAETALSSEALARWRREGSRLRGTGD
jgi:lysophospholipase L1-like esterase